MKENIIFIHGGPGLDHVIISDAGHYPFAEQHSKTLKAIKRFLKA